MEAQLVPLDSLKAYDGNAKQHDSDNIDAIANSISEFGFRNPILAWHNEDGVPEIVAGHGRAAAAKKLRMEQVPVIFVDDLTDAQRRMLTLADNQTTLMTGWDEQTLQEELDALRSQFDIRDFGFEQADKAIAGALDDRYSQNVGTVDYQPSDVKRDPSELFYQTDRFDERIEAMDAPEEIKELCRIHVTEATDKEAATSWARANGLEVQRVYDAMQIRNLRYLGYGVYDEHQNQPSLRRQQRQGAARRVRSVPVGGDRVRAR